MIEIFLLVILVERSLRNSGEKEHEQESKECLGHEEGKFG